MGPEGLMKFKNTKSGKFWSNSSINCCVLNMYYVSELRLNDLCTHKKCIISPYQLRKQIFVPMFYG